MRAHKFKYPLHNILWEVGGPVDAVPVVSLESVDIVWVDAPGGWHGEEGADAFGRLVLFGTENLAEESHGGRV